MSMHAWTRLRLTACALVLLPLAACATRDRTPVELAPGDPTAFAQHVQPYLERSCATLDCHGVEGRALRLYSELGLRSEDTLRAAPIAEGSDPSPLTDAELDANLHALAAVGLSGDSPSAQLVLRKPLAAAAGGVHHVGGVHWKSREAPGYLCLREFLLADTGAELGASCASALDELAR